MDKLCISALPIDVAKGDVNYNLSETEKWLNKAPGSTDVAVLPELFSTGFLREPAEAATLAEENTQRTKEFLLKQAKAHNFAICGSFLALENQHLYNRAFFAEPNGDFAIYDKRHLFSVSEESKVFTAGNNQSPIIRFRSWNIAIAVCYDVRFPAWIRNTGLKYDVLLVPANWPDKRAYAWTHLLQARAIENQAYVVGANRSGEDKFGCYDNQSYIFNYMGENIGKSNGPIIYATLSHAMLSEFREKFAFWKDADDILING